MDIFTVAMIVLRVADTMVGEALLPDQRLESQLLIGSKRESAFDVLNGFFQRNIRCRRNDQVEVIGHKYEFVNAESAFAAIVKENVKEQASHLRFSEEGMASVGDRGDEKCADFLRGILNKAPALKRVF